MAQHAKQSLIDLTGLPDDAVIRLPEVLRLFPIGKSTWWEGIRNGVYPKPIELGPRARGWRLGDILTLIRERTSAQGGDA